MDPIVFQLKGDVNHMAFGITREQLTQWKEAVTRGEIAFLTHYWIEPRWSGLRSVTKVGCSNAERLAAWCIANGLDPHYIHQREPYPHYDLIGPKQIEILRKEGLIHHIERFKLL